MRHCARPQRQAAAWIFWFLAGLLPTMLTPASAGITPIAAVRTASRDVSDLFRDEMQQASTKLKWRGERLTEDTVYAIALTGLSWELAWGKEHLFSLAWGDMHKVASRGKHSSRDYNTLVGRVQRAYDDRDYRSAAETAAAYFAPEEIGCDPNLKGPVGYSLLALGQPERAFPVLAAPFEPARLESSVSEENRKYREAAFEAAQHAGLRKEAIAFALSLLLEPGTDAPNVHEPALRYLEGAGVDIDRVLLGVLQAPERLRGLPNYYYAAADLMLYRASPRLLPILLHLADSDDVYLRSRALVGLGILAYQPRSNDAPNWADKVILRPLRYTGLSAAERGLIDREIQEAAGSDKYRLRAAAALAAALVGSEDALPLLKKLAKDHAYVLAPTKPGSRERRIQFPVRMAAAAGLARYGIHVETGNGEFSGRDFDRARRGGQDVSNDRRNLRRDIASQIVVSPIDVATAAPMDTLRR